MSGEAKPLRFGNQIIMKMIWCIVSKVIKLGMDMVPQR